MISRMLLRFASIHANSADSCGSCTRAWYQHVGAPLPICTSLRAIAYRLCGAFSLRLSIIATPLGLAVHTGCRNLAPTLNGHRHRGVSPPVARFAPEAPTATRSRRWKRRHGDEAGPTLPV